MSFKKLLLTAGLVAAASSASAIPISGGFEFTASAVQVDTNSDTIFDAFDFGDSLINANGVLDSDSSRAFVHEVISGSFATHFGTTALDPFVPTFGSLLYVKDIAVGTPAANNPLWTLMVDNGLGLTGQITFTASSAVMVDGANPLDMVVTGNMDFIADGSCSSLDCGIFETTASVWNVGSNGQSNVAAAVVSEPATFALLGLGLAGLGFARRKQAKA